MQDLKFIPGVIRVIYFGLVVFWYLLIFVNFTVLVSCSKTGNIPYLKLEKEIKLEMTDETALGFVASNMLLNESIIILDMQSHLVHEFSIEGKYIKQIGQKGGGPGEYYFPGSLASDSENNIYIFDYRSAKINMYDSSGNYQDNLKFSNKIPVSSPFNSLFIDSNGDILKLLNENGIAKLAKYKRSNLSQVYSTNLSDANTRIIVNHFELSNGITVDKSNNRIYYVVPCDYKIQEIDINTGKQIRSFGNKPSNFHPLNKKYYGLSSSGDLNVLSAINSSTTTVISNSLQILKGKYLLTGHYYKGNECWQVYDIDSVDIVKTIESVPKYGAYNLRYASKNGLLYVYYPPTENDSENCNGWIRVYSLEFE